MLFPSYIETRFEFGRKRSENQIAFSVCSDYFIKANRIAYAFGYEQHIVKQVARKQRGLGGSVYRRVAGDILAYHINEPRVHIGRIDTFQKGKKRAFAEQLLVDVECG